MSKCELESNPKIETGHAVDKPRSHYNKDDEFNSNKCDPDIVLVEAKDSEKITKRDFSVDCPEYLQKENEDFQDVHQSNTGNLDVNDVKLNFGGTNRTENSEETPKRHDKRWKTTKPGGLVIVKADCNELEKYRSTNNLMKLDFPTVMRHSTIRKIKSKNRNLTYNFEIEKLVTQGHNEKILNNMRSMKNLNDIIKINKEPEVGGEVLAPVDIEKLGIDAKNETSHYLEHENFKELVDCEFKKRFKISSRVMYKEKGSYKEYRFILKSNILILLNTLLAFNENEDHYTNPYLILDFDFISVMVYLSSAKFSFRIEVVGYDNSFEFKFGNKAIYDQVTYYLKHFVSNSKGQKEILLNVVMRKLTFYKHYFVEETSLGSIAKTGDILLFRGFEFNSKLQRFFTGGTYGKQTTHIF